MKKINKNVYVSKIKFNNKMKVKSSNNTILHINCLRMPVAIPISLIIAIHYVVQNLKYGI